MGKMGKKGNIGKMNKNRFRKLFPKWKQPTRKIKELAMALITTAVLTYTR